MIEKGYYHETPAQTQAQEAYREIVIESSQPSPVRCKWCGNVYTSQLGKCPLCGSTEVFG
jgi:hypothetical protein